MIIMKCNVGDERTIVLTYAGRKILKNSDIIYVDEKDLVQPEISYLVRNGLLVMVSESEEEQTTVQASIRPETNLYQCTLGKGRRMAIDSIKGTVGGGEKIEIKKSDIGNGDVNHCIRSGILILLSDEDDEKVEEFAINIEKQINTPKDAKEESDDSEPVHDVKIYQVKTDEEKVEQPKFRVEESAAAAFKEIAKEVYAEKKPAKKMTAKKASSAKKENKNKKTTRKRRSSNTNKSK